MRDEEGKSILSLHVTFIQILGSDCNDLLGGQEVMVGENKFGKVDILHANEVEITSPEQFLELNNMAALNRRTATTFKNETSSRSHAVCKIRVKNNKYLSLEDGELFIIDLAGSENSSDSQFHDKELIRQTQHINKSLMSLKECIRNRALSSMNNDKNIHIPYRNSKLTLLLKFSFELFSKTQCKTVVIANVAPSCGDVAMTKNTLRFIAPIKVGAKQKVDTSMLEANIDNPGSWTNEMLREWVKTSSQYINVDQFCPFETGK